ncbi:MAG TPA: YncE family protein [Chloroflexia bacterium]|nr:YncE family protein [Chloroflexia bacterium]
MTLKFEQHVELPKHETGGFDHADIHLPSGHVFVAHTALGQVDIVDGPAGNYLGAVPDCPEASGVLSANAANLMFAAARSTGQILVLRMPSGELVRTIKVGSAPNGLAWDEGRQHLVVANVKDFKTRFISPETGKELLEVALPGRPRWCVYDQGRDCFWVNISDPALVVGLAGDTGALSASLSVAYRGPHGIAIDEATGRLLVACDSGDLVALDPDSGNELGHTQIAGPPDVVWYNSLRQCLYVAIGKPGVVQVIDIRDMKVLEEISTEEGAHTLTFDQTRQRLYIFLPQSSRMAVYNAA